MNKKHTILTIISVISMIAALINIGLYSTDNIDKRLFFYLFVFFNVVFLLAFSLFSFINKGKKIALYFTCALQLLPLLVLLGRDG